MSQKATQLHQFLLGACGSNVLTTLMHVFVQDSNTVPVSSTEIFRLVQSSPINASVVLKNTGLNYVLYQFQESADHVTWSDIAGAGGTLNPSGSAQVAMLKVTSSLAGIRLTASGNSTMEFSVTRYFSRVDGGALPLLSI